MGQIKGANYYKLFKQGKPLTRKQAQLAHCYECNGLEEGRVDCGCKKTCPSYQYSPYKGVEAGTLQEAKTAKKRF